MPHKTIMINENNNNSNIQIQLSSVWPEWRITRLLGKGSFGAVYEIVRDDLGSSFKCALKILQMEIPVDAALPNAGAMKDGLFDRQKGIDLFTDQSISSSDSGIPEVSRTSQPSDWIEDYLSKRRNSKNSNLKELSTGYSSEIRAGYKSDNRAIIMDAAGEETLEAFVREVSNEINVMMKLRGMPNIVSIEDYAVLSGKGSRTILIRMEKLISLDGVLRQTDRMDRDTIIRLGTDICRALEYCEKKMILHRDIKPSNIFYSDAMGGFKLGDFGISRTMESIHEQMTMSGVGTLQYMAPEIYFGEKYNNTVDIYSLGLVLYYLLNGNHPPFFYQQNGGLFSDAVHNVNGKNTWASSGNSASHEAVQSVDSVSDLSRLHSANMRRLRKESLPSPVNADSALAAVILRATDPDSSKRYQSAKDMLEALIDCRGKQGKSRPRIESNSVPVLKRPELRDRKKNLLIPVLLGTAAVLLLFSFAMIFMSNGSGMLQNKKKHYNLDNVDGTDVLAAGAEQVNSSERGGNLPRISDNPMELTDTWKDIISASNDGSYKERYRIGDTRDLNLGPEGVITMKLVAMDEDELADGSGKAPMTWIADELLKSNYCMNSEGTNEGGWKTSDMRLWLRDTVLPLVPSELRSGIREVKKYSYSCFNRRSISTADTIWIPSAREIYYADHKESVDELREKEGAAYIEAFPDNASRIRRINGDSGPVTWWLRSDSYYYNISFIIVRKDGNWFNNIAENECGVAIGFCL